MVKRICIDNANLQKSVLKNSEAIGLKDESGAISTLFSNFLAYG